MKYSEKLYNRYLDEIKSWDWKAIKEDAITNVYEDFDGEKRASCYLGSVLSIAPSGKYYTFWTTNQTAKDVIKDEAFFNALDTVAEENAMYVTNGEGDPCDLYVEMCME